jgi:hypothetical protein
MLLTWLAILLLVTQSHQTIWYLTFLAIYMSFVVALSLQNSEYFPIF